MRACRPRARSRRASLPAQLDDPSRAKSDGGARRDSKVGSDGKALLCDVKKCDAQRLLSTEIYTLCWLTSWHCIDSFLMVSTSYVSLMKAHSSHSFRTRRSADVEPWKVTTPPSLHIAQHHYPDGEYFERGRERDACAW
jgi:hypothetical protein